MKADAALDYWLERPPGNHSHRDELTDGYWHTHPGGLKTWVNTGPVITGLDDIEDNERGLWERIARNLENIPAPTTLAPKTTICDDCGCLLLAADETCPSCLVWAERAHVATSWRIAEERFTTTRKDAA